MDILEQLSSDICKTAYLKFASLYKEAAGGMANPAAASKVSKGIMKGLSRPKAPAMSMPPQNASVSTAVTGLTNGLPTMNATNAAQKASQNIVNPGNLNNGFNQAGMNNQSVLPLL